MRKNLVVLYGGRSTEHDISIITAIGAINAVNICDYKIFPIYARNGNFYLMNDFDKIKNYANFEPKKYNRVLFDNGKLYIVRRKSIKELTKVDAVLMACHGSEGENGIMQGMLELNDIPYTSTDVLFSSIGMSKWISKLLVESLGIRVAKGKSFSVQNALDELDSISRLGYPLIVKPSNLGSSIGVKIVNSNEELYSAIELVALYDSEIIVEEYLSPAREFNCAILNNGNKLIVSDVEEIVNRGEIFSYEDKYIGRDNSARESKGECNRVMIPSDDEMYKRITQTTRNIYSQLGMSGLVRIDYLVKDDEIYFNEVNTIPGSLSNYLFTQYDYSELIDNMINGAINASNERRAKIRVFNSSIFNENLLKRK